MCDFEKNIEGIKSKMENLKLSESARERILKRMDSEIEKVNLEENMELKNKKFSLFRNKKFSPKRKVLTWQRNLATICTACVIISTCAFADEIEDNMGFLFQNTYPEFHMADVNLKSVDMDYITHDGVSIKIDSYLIQDDSLYLVFNVKSEEEFDRCFFDEYILVNENGELLYDTEDGKKFFDVKIKNNYSTISKGNMLYFLKLSNLNKEMLKYDFNIKIKKINIGKSNNRKIIDESIEMNIEV